jgi:hypothetical protein
MEKTLTITSAQYSYTDYGKAWSSNWASGSEMYAARESTGGKYYYCSEL